MLDQPKTIWVCSCGHEHFSILLCPKCKGEDTHVIGFQCQDCEMVYSTIPIDPNTIEEYENVVH